VNAAPAPSRKVNNKRVDGFTKSSHTRTALIAATLKEQAQK
jgi:hypothetical protein